MRIIIIIKNIKRQDASVHEKHNRKNSKNKKIIIKINV